MVHGVRVTQSSWGADDTWFTDTIAGLTIDDALAFTEFRRITDVQYSTVAR